MKSDGTVAMNGTFQANNGVGSNPGTAGTPAYGFLAYPGMGMYVASGPGLAMSTNSIERLRIDSAGNVGIGTTPAVRLDVASNTIGTTGTAVAKFSNTVNPTAAATGTYPGLIGYAMTSSSFMGSAAIVGGVFQAAVTGNTASEVRGADAMAQNMSSSNLSTMRGLNAVTSNTGTGTVTNSYGVYTVANNPGSSGPVTNSYGVYIDTPVNATNRYGLYQADTTGINYFGGKVGIGITSPSNLLEVATASATGYTASSASSSLPSNANQGITLRNTSTAAATYVIHPFMVNAGATQQSAYLGVVGSGGYTPAVVFGQQTGASSYSESMRIDSTGQLGIGTVTPQARLDVAGSARIQGQINSGSQTGTTANIDWNLGNSITTSYNCGSAFSFANLRDGGSYTLVATDTGTNTCTFNTTTTGLDAGTVTYKFKVANSSRASLSYTVYKLNRVGAFVFVDWAAFNY